MYEPINALDVLPINTSKRAMTSRRNFFFVLVFSLTLLASFSKSRAIWSKSMTRWELADKTPYRTSEKRAINCKLFHDAIYSCETFAIYGSLCFTHQRNIGFFVAAHTWLYLSPFFPPTINRVRSSLCPSLCSTIPQLGFSTSFWDVAVNFIRTRANGVFDGG